MCGVGDGAVAIEMLPTKACIRLDMVSHTAVSWIWDMFFDVFLRGDWCEKVDFFGDSLVDFRSAKCWLSIF